MRKTIGLIFAATVWAQQPTPPAPPPMVPQVRQISQMINDYGNLERYAAENLKVQPPAGGEAPVVFMGDSITDSWDKGPNRSNFFPDKPYIGRGISGQVTAQMLLRFYPDVVALKPRAVVILAGTNDLGGNIGPVPLEAIENNLMAMADVAKANNIRVVLASVLPVCDYHRPQTLTRSPERILALNRWMKEYADKNRHIYLDYFSATVDDKGFFKAELTNDRLHPNAAGYQVMAPLAEKSIAQALSR